MDLNCDLGEGEPAARTRALLSVVTSASIACGGHAGDASSMRACLRLCRELGVKAGAHPGFADRENFGRKEQSVSAAELELLVLQQAGAFAQVAAAEDVRPHHIKLHGALYNQVEKNPALAKCYVRLVREFFPGWRIYALAKGAVADAAAKAGHPVWREAFADRAYTPLGTLVPRAEAGSVISSPSHIRERMALLIDEGRLITADNTPIRLQAETICVHADSPGAIRIARALAGLINVRRRGAR